MVEHYSAHHGLTKWGDRPRRGQDITKNESEYKDLKTNTNVTEILTYITHICGFFQPVWVIKR